MKLLYIDLFCGAGGTSTGVSAARLNGERCAEVIACVNHDANAIASHASNHPEAMHYTEDIRTLKLSPLVAHTERKRKEYPGALVVLWASLVSFAKHCVRACREWAIPGIKKQEPKLFGNENDRTNNAVAQRPTVVR